MFDKGFLGSKQTLRMDENSQSRPDLLQQDLVEPNLEAIADDKLPPISNTTKPVNTPKDIKKSNEAIPKEVEVKISSWQKKGMVDFTKGTERFRYPKEVGERLSHYPSLV